MNKEKVIEQIKNKYPDKDIFLDPPESENPTEIIVELEPSSQHPEHSLALAIVGKSNLHYHKNTTEIYEATEGTLKVFVEGKEHILNPGEKITIKPRQLHSAEGDESWFLTHSKPGWTFEDHIVWVDVKDAVEKSWSAESSFHSNNWSNKNPAYGQCAVTALLVQDELGGELIKCDVVGENDSHFFNKLSGGQIIDLTRSQFSDDATLENEKVAERKKMLSHPGTQERYETLKTAVESNL